MDVIEIDAASNNGVDNIRELRESVKYPPAAGKKKVYIIDEVHMLSAGAFNALLKTLEEPPGDVMFILATTEPQKLPATILSRCMKLDFRRVPEEELAKGMKEICKKEGVDIADDALKLVAVNADGSVRDGLSILDQCISMGSAKVSRKDVLEFLGASGEEVFIELTDYINSGKTEEALLLVNRVLSDGKEVRRFLKDWMGHYRNLMISQFMKNNRDMLNMSIENAERVRFQSEGMGLIEIRNGILALSEAVADARWSSQPRVLLELCVVRLSEGVMLASQRKVSEAKISQQVETHKGVARKENPQEQIIEKKISVQNGENSASQENFSKSGAEPMSDEKKFDLLKIWKKVFEEGEAAKGSFNLIRTGTELIDIGTDTFTVMTSNANVKRYVEKNRTALEVLMGKHAGKHRKLKILEGESDVRHRPDVEEVRKQASELLGINVEIK